MWEFQISSGIIGGIFTFLLIIAWPSIEFRYRSLFTKTTIQITCKYPHRVQCGDILIITDREGLPALGEHSWYTTIGTPTKTELILTPMDSM